MLKNFIGQSFKFVKSSCIKRPEWNNNKGRSQRKGGSKAPICPCTTAWPKCRFGQRKVKLKICLVQIYYRCFYMNYCFT